LISTTLDKVTNVGALESTSGSLSFMLKIKKCGKKLEIFYHIMYVHTYSVTYLGILQ
jgi:hypothetical protein